MPTRSFSGGATSLKKSRFHRRHSSFISFFIPVHHCSSPANPRWIYLEAGYWTSFTSSSTSPVAAARVIPNLRIWIFALPKLTRRQVSNLVPLM